MQVDRILSLVLPLLMCLGAALRADTVILKTGEKLDGKILNETDSEMTISVQVTATIKDERVLKKADIDKVLKVLPDLEAWTPLAGLAPGVDSLERDEYGRISAALQYFVTRFPESVFAPLAKEKLASFAAEQKRVEGGEVKMDGRWLTKDKVVEERIQIGGRILLNRMKRAVAAAQLTEAMGIFDQLEKGFIGSASYPDAVELARQVLPSLKAAVDQRQAQYKRRVEDEKQRLATAKGIEKDQLTAILKNERAAAEAAVAAVEKAGVKWLPLQPVTERSLASLSSRISSEAARLSGIQIEKIRESLKSADTALIDMANGDLDGAEKALTDATNAWPANELAKRLRVRLTELKKPAGPAKQAPPKATPVPAPKPRPSAAIPASDPASEPPIADVTPVEPSFFKKPVFFVGLAIAVAVGVIGGKVIGRFRSAEKNLLDK